MPSYLDWLEAGSQSHQATRKGSALTVGAINSGELASLQAFQPIAQDVLRREGEGYAVHLTHENSMFPGNMIDMIVISIDPRT